jgi:hypothetical protein
MHHPSIMLLLLLQGQAVQLYMWTTATLHASKAGLMHMRSHRVDNSHNQFHPARLHLTHTNAHVIIQCGVVLHAHCWQQCCKVHQPIHTTSSRINRLLNS